MMAAYIALSPINGKSKVTQTPINAARHNLRTIEAELLGREGDRIDPERTKLNRVLSGPGHPDGVVALMDKLIVDFGAKVIRKDQIVMFEVVVSPKQAVQDMDGFFEASRLWMVDWFACPLVSAVTHHDEAEPHMHMLFVPLRDGRLQGDAVMGRRADVAKMHRAFQQQIGGRFGLMEQKRLTSKQRAGMADVVLAHIMRGRPANWLPADALHQLRRAIANAGNLDELVLALGVDAGVENPIGIQSGNASANSHSQTPIGVRPEHRKGDNLTIPEMQENTANFTDPYQGVGVAHSATREVPSKTANGSDAVTVRCPTAEALSEHGNGNDKQLAAA